MATHLRLSHSSSFQFWDQMGSFLLVAWPTRSMPALMLTLRLHPMGPSPNLGFHSCGILCHGLRMKGLTALIFGPFLQFPRIQLPLLVSLVTGTVPGLLCLQFQRTAACSHLSHMQQHCGAHLPAKTFVLSLLPLSSDCCS